MSDSILELEQEIARLDGVAREQAATLRAVGTVIDRYETIYGGIRQVRYVVEEVRGTLVAPAALDGGA